MYDLIHGLNNIKYYYVSIQFVNLLDINKYMDHYMMFVLLMVHLY